MSEGGVAPPLERLAGAPISWGVCEVPGWGVALPPERVLAEMRSLGLRATEAGPDGYLPSEPGALRELLGRHELRLVGGFLPVVLHERSAWPESLERALAKADLFAAAGADVLVSAVVADLGWSPRFELSPGEWRTVCEGLERLDDLAGERGLRHVVHPHAGTLVEVADDVARVLDGSESALCLDTGHLAIGGADPVRLATDAPDRVGHVHLKDVSPALAERVRAGELTLVDATRDGLFRPLGEGGAPVAGTVAALERAGYGGWLVLEQDTMLDEVPATGHGPLGDVRRSVDYLLGVLAGFPAAPSRERGTSLPPTRR